MQSVSASVTSNSKVSLILPSQLAVGDLVVAACVSSTAAQLNWSNQISTPVALTPTTQGGYLSQVFFGVALSNSRPGLSFNFGSSQFAACSAQVYRGGAAPTATAAELRTQGSSTPATCGPITASTGAVVFYFLSGLGAGAPQSSDFVQRESTTGASSGDVLVAASGTFQTDVSGTFQVGWMCTTVAFDP